MGTGSKGAEHSVIDAGIHYLAELDARLELFFSDQADGLDIPPAILYQLEGFIDAGVVSGFMTRSDIKARLVALAKRYADADTVAVYENDNRIILHLRMSDAPVYPSKIS